MGATALVAPSDVGSVELVSIGSTSVTASASVAVGAVAAMQGVLSLPLLPVIISGHLQFSFAYSFKTNDSHELSNATSDMTVVFVWAGSRNIF